MASDSLASYDHVARKVKGLVQGIVASEGHQISLVFKLEDVKNAILLQIRKHLSDPRGSPVEYPWCVKATSPLGPRWFLDKFEEVVLDLGCSSLPWDVTLSFQPGQRLLRSTDTRSNNSVVDVFLPYAWIKQLKIGEAPRHLQLIDIDRCDWSQPKASESSATGVDVVNAHVVSWMPQHLRENLGTISSLLLGSLDLMRGVETAEEAYLREVEKLTLKSCFVADVFHYPDALPVEITLMVSGEMPGTTSSAFRETMSEVIKGIGRPARLVRGKELSMVQGLSRPASDCIRFICGEKSFYVSKARVLEESESFSPVIRGCFDNPGNRESSSSTYPIDDFEVDVVEQFMLFLQYGATPNAEQFAHDLALIADKYQVARLLETTELYLVREAVRTASWMQNQGQDEGHFHAFLELCRLAGFVYLPILLSCLHFLLLDFEEKFSEWIIWDEWRDFLSSTNGADFLDRRLRAITTLTSDDFPLRSGEAEKTLQKH